MERKEGDRNSERKKTGKRIREREREGMENEERKETVHETFRGNFSYLYQEEFVIVKEKDRMCDK